MCADKKCFFCGSKNVYKPFRVWSNGDKDWACENHFKQLAKNLAEAIDQDILQPNPLKKVPEDAKGVGYVDVAGCPNYKEEEE